MTRAEEIAIMIVVLLRILNTAVSSAWGHGFQDYIDWRFWMPREKPYKLPAARTVRDDLAGAMSFGSSPTEHELLRSHGLCRHGANHCNECNW